MSILEDKYFAANKANWNKRVSIHKDSSFYDIEGFKKGEKMLNEIELTELGHVSGKSLLHLQCHFGLDSMSWSRLGAKVTGVDFSEEAIQLANQLNNEVGLDATFVCANVYDLKEYLNEKFDIVFTSYGVIGWLPDLNRWASIISHFLKPEGIFYMAEFHPVLWMFDDEFKSIKYSYFNEGVIELDQEGTYADKNMPLNLKEYSWNHSISEVLNALLIHGFKIQLFKEYNYSPYDCFANTVKKEDRKFYINGYENKLPMVYSVKAIKN
jgi:2-polyprenyl-3-methyl-5-hydroxy-6-metoxy-1,4-benzoquinol methylase